MSLTFQRFCCFRERFSWLVALLQLLGWLVCICLRYLFHWQDHATRCSNRKVSKRFREIKVSYQEKTYPKAKNMASWVSICYHLFTRFCDKSTDQISRCLQMSLRMEGSRRKPTQTMYVSKEILQTRQQHFGIIVASTPPTKMGSYC